MYLMHKNQKQQRKLEKFTARRRSSKKPGSGSDDTESMSEYDARVFVLELIETRLNRSATDEEIDRYQVLRSKKSILKKFDKDHHLPPSKKTKKTKQAPPPLSEPQSTTTTTTTPADDQTETTKEGFVGFVGNEGGSSSDEKSGYDHDENAAEDGAHSGERVCLDKHMLLQRLKETSRSINQLRHMVSMY